VQITSLSLRDFRSYHEVELHPGPGLTVVVGANGQGKTNLLEAVGWLATLSSFRGVPNDALVRVGATAAVVRADVAGADGRAALIEAEITSGRPRVQVNRQRLQRGRDLLGVFQVSVFAPDDLALVKAGPAERRRFLDSTLVALQPRHEVLRSDLDRIVRQRNALLKQSKGRLTPEVEATLEVWDQRMAEVGDVLGAARAQLVADLGPVLSTAYRDLAGGGDAPVARYEAPWRDAGLAAALVGSRAAELRRGVSLVGPHRDDLRLDIGSLPARTHASQGEQRSLALALRLAAHRLVTDRLGSAPVLLLDDVFSELDGDRTAALVDHLPPGQAMLTTAGVLPAGTSPDQVLRLNGGRLTPG
jgi:DNA replication and repair protein RecF